MHYDCQCFRLLGFPFRFDGSWRKFYLQPETLLFIPLKVLYHDFRNVKWFSVLLMCTCLRRISSLKTSFCKSFLSRGSKHITLRMLTR